MATHIRLALPTHMARPTDGRPSSTTETTPLHSILILWAVVMLSIGAAAHFGNMPSGVSKFELLAPL
jgi:hypothetical protein